MLENIFTPLNKISLEYHEKIKEEKSLGNNKIFTLIIFGKRNHRKYCQAQPNSSFKWIDMVFTVVFTHPPSIHPLTILFARRDILPS